MQTTTITFSEASHKIVFDGNLNIVHVREMGDLMDLQGQRVDEYSSDGISFDPIAIGNLQLPRFKTAVSSGNCYIRLRKI